MSQPKILTFDIETSPMLVWTFGLRNQNHSIQQIHQHSRVISWAAKWLHEDKVLFASEFHNGKMPMLRKMWQLLDEADIVVHFNGDSFDEPQLQREFVQNGLGLHAPVKSIDLYKGLKKTLYFPSYKLDYIAQQLAVGAKVSHSGINLWIDCLLDPPADDPNRQKRAWSLMRKYNKGDVTVTEDLYLETREILPNHPNMNMFLPDDDIEAQERCPLCTSNNLELRGYTYLTAGKYRRFQCRECGKWSRSKRSVALTETRAVQ